MKDSPAEGCHIGNRVYRGRGPKIAPKPLMAHGAVVGHGAEVQAAGHAMTVPIGAAQVLQQAGFVRILGMPAIRASYEALATPLQVPRTPEQMREHARVLEALADGLERDLAEHEQAAQQAEAAAPAS